jgi:hypothetical protein
LHRPIIASSRLAATGLRRPGSGGRRKKTRARRAFLLRHGTGPRRRGLGQRAEMYIVISKP